MKEWEKSKAGGVITGQMVCSALIKGTKEKALLASSSSFIKLENMPKTILNISMTVTDSMNNDVTDSTNNENLDSSETMRHPWVQPGRRQTGKKKCFQQRGKTKQMWNSSQIGVYISTHLNKSVPDEVLEVRGGRGKEYLKLCWRTMKIRRHFGRDWLVQTHRTSIYCDANNQLGYLSELTEHGHDL